MNPIFIVAALAAALAACVPATPSYLVAAADPAIPSPGPRYATVTAGVKDYQPLGPRDWRELNRQVAPGSGQPSSEGARRGR
ncbi:MAG: hypothetical protein K0R61_2255 [Microvirga sp.]|jgi:hypothetical protein|nr:hypothetical protein [Microvirga sp.]MCE3246817.1 hypothetical protein [Geminicoccaceae bacterium]MDF2766856.1 hypothetical protein [Rhodospirillales bacterium]MDF2971805.1 hypothetical protein [Microvirga sp.]